MTTTELCERIEVLIAEAKETIATIMAYSEVPVDEAAAKST